MNWNHQYAKVNGINMHYVDHGAGPLIVLMHGFPEFWYSWRRQIPVLAEAGFRVVAPDMRGYNETDKPKDIAAYDTNVIAKDIVELIKHLGYDKAIIVGHDWGGGVAWRFAENHPEMVEKLIVLNCPPPAILAQHLLSNFAQLKRSWYMFLFQIPGLAEFGMKRNLKQTLTKAYRGWAHNKDAFTHEDIDKYVACFNRPYGLTGPMNWYRAAFRTSLKPGGRKQQQIQPDTLVIWGEDDKALGKELTYGLEKYFENNYDIKYIPDCSHWTQNDAPELVNEYILSYIKPAKPQSA